MSRRARELNEGHGVGMQKGLWALTKSVNRSLPCGAPRAPRPGSAGMSFFNKKVTREEAIQGKNLLIPTGGRIDGALIGYYYMSSPY